MEQWNIAVLMTCHNRKEKTLQCLKSLFEQEGINERFRISVFMVDDKSTDGTVEAVRSTYPTVRIIEGNGELYWNKGMHLAWENAINADRFNYYFWLNDDVRLFPNAIYTMLDTHQQARSECLVCGSTCSEITKTFTYGVRTKKGEIINPGESIQYGELMNGNIVLISEKIFQEVGNLDPIFIHAIGDHDYSLRANDKGIKTAVPPGYQGYCENHIRLPKWCLPDIPMGQRFKSLYSPLGNAHPKYFFIYERRHYGTLEAVKHYFTIHLRALIPNLWKQ